MELYPCIHTCLHGFVGVSMCLCSEKSYPDKSSHEEVKKQWECREYETWVLRRMWGSGTTKGVIRMEKIVLSVVRLAIQCKHVFKPGD